MTDTFLSFFTLRAASSLEVPTLSTGGTSCPTSPSISQRLLKSSASETNVWARLANTSSTQDGGSSDTRYWNRVLKISNVANHT